MNTRPDTLFDDLADADGLDDAKQAPPDATPDDFLAAQVKAAANLIPCPKCQGSGVYHGRSSHGRHCFKCAGAGKVKGLSQDPRAIKAREKARQRRLDEANAEALARKNNRLQFVKDHTEVYDWLIAKAPTFNFAASLLDALNKYGDLTTNQVGAVYSCIAKSAARAEQRAVEREVSKVNVGGEGFTALLAAFQRAKASGLKYPALEFERITFKLAPDSGKNPGCLYVTADPKRGARYYGKVTPAGAFYPSGDCTPELSAEIARIGRDPLGESVAHGKKTGRCAICSRHLENAESVERGIGPICYGKFFGG